jgi:drug/metabolite transporter (DMT)-like permease
MSVVAPLAATATVVPAVFGFMIGERPSPTALAGIALAVLGVALAGRSKSEGGQKLGRGVGLALLAALFFGLGFVTLDTASEDSVVWTLLAIASGPL